MIALLLFAFADELGPAPSLQNPTAVFRVQDYQFASNRTDALRILVEVAVAADGRAVGCETIDWNGPAGDDVRLCEIAKTRARFLPARDDEGEAVASAAYIAFSWYNPALIQPVFPPPGPDLTLSVASLPDGQSSAQVTITQILRPSGEVERCIVTRPSGITVIDDNACTLIPEHLQKKPFLDAAGTPIRTRRSTRVMFEVQGAEAGIAPATPAN